MFAKPSHRYPATDLPTLGWVRMWQAKLRAAADGGKKKKAAKHWEAGGKQRGEKARGSDNKYQGE
jgi:hypothetical protein